MGEERIIRLYASAQERDTTYKGHTAKSSILCQAQPLHSCYCAKLGVNLVAIWQKMKLMWGWILWSMGNLNPWGTLHKVAKQQWPILKT
jgi:hypothetical protein